MTAVVRLWGSELSPFALKLQALCAYARLPFRWLPAGGKRFENLRTNLAILRAQRLGCVRRHPQASPLDEYPLVPYLVVDNVVHYDTSALALWLDDQHAVEPGPLFPTDPSLRLVAQLIDEMFDEIGLYMVHHNRWVLSATTNDAGRRLARELARLFPAVLAALIGRRFARRQARRLPYLFSVAPSGFAIPGLTAALTPPSRRGFPPTHALLDQLWHRTLEAMEHVLTRQPFLLGGRFTVADASAYGQLAMNLSDPSAAQELQRRAPRTDAWLRSIHAATAPPGATSAGTLAAASPAELCAPGALGLSDALQPLLALGTAAFVPLMKQNDAAYEAARKRGETMFNEAAFDQGRALYDGELCEHPFRSVVKTFQVRVWRELRAAWEELSDPERQNVSSLGCRL